MPSIIHIGLANMRTTSPSLQIQLRRYLGDEVVVQEDVSRPGKECVLGGVLDLGP